MNKTAKGILRRLSFAGAGAAIAGSVIYGCQRLSPNFSEQADDTAPANVAPEKTAEETLIIDDGFPPPDSP